MREVPISRVGEKALVVELKVKMGPLEALGWTKKSSLWPELGDCWGVDDLSFCGRYDGLLYVRLNALGAYCLRITGAYEAAIPQTAGDQRC